MQFLILVVFLYFNFKFKFIQFRFSKLFGKKLNFNGFFLSIGTHVGIGNIVGVYLAIVSGGPGAIFWMWTFSFLSAALSVAENTLAKYFETDVKGTNAYIINGLKSKKIAFFYTLILLMSYGLLFPMVQIGSLNNILGAGYSTKIILYCTIAIVVYMISSKLDKLFKFINFLVIFMGICYLLLGGYVVVSNFNKILDIFNLIITDAFTYQSIIGGGMGYGIKRSLFSNEAGLGTTPNISSIGENHYLSVGILQGIGVFIDTLVICTISAFIVLLSDNYQQGLVTVYNSHFGFLGEYILINMIMFFSISTLIGVYLMCERSIKLTRNKKIFKLLFVISLIASIYLNFKIIWKLVDIGVIILLIVNLYCLYRLRDVFVKIIK